MGIEAELREELDRWERRETATTQALPYLLLAVSTVITLLRPAPGVPLGTVLGLTLVAAVWVLWFLTLHPRWHARASLMGLYYAGLTAVSTALVVLAPWYGIFAFIGYVHAYLFLGGRWRYLGVLVTSMIMSVTYIGGVEHITADTWWLWCAIALVAVGMSLAAFRAVDVADRHGRKQDRALAALNEANRRLETALEENAGLHAQLLVQAREAGVQDERQRMAREIHDTLAQTLAGILTQLQATERGTYEPELVRRHVASAVTLAREGLTEARRTVQAVEPELLAEARLPEAIGEVTRRWAETNQADAVLTTTGDPRRMHTDVEVTLLRTAQEALANVTKHAAASRVGLTLSYMGDVVTLDVRDDGVGFDPREARPDRAADGGFGLTGLRQRVQRLAGRFAVESEPGGGTAVSASVPAIPAGGEQ